MACWLHVAIATGARRGEICALRWSDVDLVAATVRIERSVSVTRAAGIFVKTTKTDRARLVSLTSQATESLAQRRNRVLLTADDAGQPGLDAEFVFADERDVGGLWRPHVVTRRWNRLRAATGHEGVRLHDLRHFVATELLTAGFDVRTVSNRLGHARTSTTMDIYWGWVPARDQEAAAYLGSLLVPS